MIRLSITIRLLLAHRLIDLVKLLVPEDELERVRRLSPVPEYRKDAEARSRRYPAAAMTQLNGTLTPFAPSNRLAKDGQQGGTTWGGLGSHQ
jgi:hypothetical protein